MQMARETECAFCWHWDLPSVCGRVKAQVDRTFVTLKGKLEGKQ